MYPNSIESIARNKFQQIMVISCPQAMKYVVGGLKYIYNTLLSLNNIQTSKPNQETPRKMLKMLFCGQ